MPKAKKEEAKKPLISINTEEPLEDDKIELVPGTADDEESEDDDLKIDEEEVDPFGDKWEK